MSENVPYIWRVNYRNNMTSPEKVLEIALFGASVSRLGYTILRLCLILTQYPSIARPARQNTKSFGLKPLKDRLLTAR